MEQTSKKDTAAAESLQDASSVSPADKVAVCQGQDSNQTEGTIEYDNDIEEMNIDEYNLFVDKFADDSQKLQKGGYTKHKQDVNKCKEIYKDMYLKYKKERECRKMTGRKLEDALNKLQALTAKYNMIIRKVKIMYENNVKREELEQEEEEVFQKIKQMTHNFSVTEK